MVKINADECDLGINYNLQEFMLTVCNKVGVYTSWFALFISAYASTNSSSCDSNLNTREQLM